MSYFISFGVFEKQISQLSTIFRIGKRDARLGGGHTKKIALNLIEK